MLLVQKIYSYQKVYSTKRFKLCFDTVNLVMKCEFIRQGGQMELLVSANVTSMKVTGVVPATTPPMPKLEQKSNS